MMKTKLFILSVCLPILAFAQKVPTMQKKATGIEHHIDIYTAIQNKQQALILSDFAEDIEFVPLETTDECLLDENIMNVVVTRQDIIVYDLNACYRFNRQGKFMNRIGTQGNGPGEYVKSLYITVDTLNQWVYMGDYNQKKFIKYDYNGKHLADLKTKGVGMNNFLYKPNYILMENNFYLYEKKGKRFSMALYSEKDKKIISRMSCDYKDNIPAMSICSPIAFQHKENTYLKDFWCDTIYRMTDAFHLQTYAYIDKGKFKHRTEDDKTLTGGKPTARDFLVLSVDNMAESDRYIYIATNKGRVFYDKKEKKTFAGGTLKKPFVSAKDDLYGSPGLMDISINGNEIYSYRFAHELIESEKGKHSINDSRYDTYLKMIEKLDEEDNPVIMIVKMKK